MNPDIYYKKTITYKYGGRDLQFRVAQDLFSSFQVDLGTQFLIRTLTLGELFVFQKILDLGCGYGPIGITLKTRYPDATVHMVDKDALAVDYSRQNAELNSLSTVVVYPSLGYKNLTTHDFDLIISNIPAKAGGLVIKHLLEDAVYHLAPAGNVAIVVIKELEETVNKMLTANNNVEIIRQKSRPGHTVFQYKFKNYHSDDRRNGNDFYDMEIKTFSTDTTNYRLEAAYGLDEPENVNYGTKLLLDALYKNPRRNFKNCAVYNPGLGHIAIGLSKWNTPDSIILVDRDLLSLHYSQKNLVLNGFNADSIKIIHRTGFGAGDRGGLDLITGILREDEGPAPVTFTVDQMVNTMAAKGNLILAGTSTGITRVAQVLTDDVRLKDRRRQKYRGFSSIVFQRD
jgi:16S rRNA (guanine1207-N2)-methyltransferase